jgi:hypothetical protein
MHRVVLGISDQAFYHFQLLFALKFALPYYYFLSTLLLILTRPSPSFSPRPIVCTGEDGMVVSTSSSGCAQSRAWFVRMTQNF